MSEPLGNFGEELRARLHAKTVAAEAEAAKSVEAEAVARQEARSREIQARQDELKRREIRPELFEQIAADARDAAAIMRERRATPRELLGVRGDRNSTSRTIPVWAIEFREKLFAHNIQESSTYHSPMNWKEDDEGSTDTMWNYDSEMFCEGIALDQDGNLWNFKTEKVYRSKSSRYRPDPKIIGNILPFRFAHHATPLKAGLPLIADGRTSEEDIVDAHLVDLSIGDHSQQPIVQQFRSSLISLVEQTSNETAD